MRGWYTIGVPWIFQAIITTSHSCLKWRTVWEVYRHAYLQYLLWVSMVVSPTCPPLPVPCPASLKQCHRGSHVYFIPSSGSYSVILILFQLPVFCFMTFHNFSYQNLAFEKQMQHHHNHFRGSEITSESWIFFHLKARHCMWMSQMLWKQYVPSSWECTANKKIHSKPGIGKYKSRQPK